ncbi:MAG: hypothetical protein U0R19_23310 [Bryobacteraceae bacterium]
MDAIRIYQEACERFPGQPSLWNNLGVVQLEAGFPAEASRNFAHSLRLRADAGVYSNLLRSLLFDPDCSEDELWSYSCGFAAWMARLEENREYSCEAKRMLRIGYISEGYRAHPDARKLEAALRYHCQGFEVFCYPTNVVQDAVTAHLRKLRDCHWRDLSGLDDDTAAAVIRGDGVDILVESSGHHGPNRLPVLARRVAPIQVSLTTYPATLGLRTIDYRITDDVIDPQEAGNRYIEKLVRLPHPAFYYTPPSKATKVSRLPALGNGYITFAAFHRLAKLSPQTLGMWGEVLRQVPDSRLLLHHAYGGGSKVSRALRAPYERQLSQYGISPRRLKWVGALSTEETMKLYGECDIGLDTFPFSGSATTLEALWMGVPVVTMTGAPVASRYSASFLHELGMQEWITRSPEEFVAFAVQAANQVGVLARWRKSLRPALRGSTLMNGPLLVGNLERIYSALWSLRARSAKETKRGSRRMGS